MGELGYNVPRASGNKNGNGEGRKDHGNTQRLKDHTPTNVFDKPEQDMQIFHLPEFGWYYIEIF